jgi:Skp family chaperone for outer membrane proteins
MKIAKILTITAMAVILSTGSFAMASEGLAKNSNDFTVATVDIPQVVENSSAIKALKDTRKNQLDDLGKFVENAKADVAKETNADKKKALEDKYNKELNVRKDAIDKDFSQKLVEIDKDITTSIKVRAKKLGFNLVLVKSSVIDGGIDITSEVLKDIK